MVNEDKVKSDKVRIVGGPNKWDLIIKSLVDSQTVFFDVKAHRTEVEIKVKVEGLINLGTEDTAWRVLGRVFGNFQNLWKLFHDPRYFLRVPDKPVDDPIYCWATYDCKSRTGEMRIAIIEINEDSPFDPKYFLF